MVLITCQACRIIVSMKQRKDYDLNKIIQLYKSGCSSPEIKETIDVPITIRQIQRIIKDSGIKRSMSETKLLSIKRGRMIYKTKPNKIKRKTIYLKMRMQALLRDNFKCVMCGADKTVSRIEIDHINENKNDNRLENLQTLCEDCNKGKAYLNNPHFTKKQ